MCGITYNPSQGFSTNKGLLYYFLGYLSDHWEMGIHLYSSYYLIELHFIQKCQ